MSPVSRTTARWVAVAVVAATLAVGFIIWSVNKPSRSGPIPPITDQSIAFMPIDVGASLSFGAPKVFNSGSEPAKVLDISLAAAEDDSGATVTDVYILDMTGIGLTAGIGPGFPPAVQATHAFVRAKGATLKPNTWYQVMFVVRADEAGKWNFPTFDLLYEVNGKKYITTNLSGLRVCAPAGTVCR